MAILGLAIKSFRNRKFTTGLTVLSIALSVMLLLGIEKIRQGAETSFTSTISGTDLIVGARSSPVQLLLYSVFHIGNPTNNISGHSYEEISEHPTGRVGHTAITRRQPQRLSRGWHDNPVLSAFSICPWTTVATRARGVAWSNI